MTQVANRILSYALTHTSYTCRSRDRTRSVPCGNEVFAGNCSICLREKSKQTYNH